MSIRDYKITDAQFSEKGVIAAPDTLTGTAAENKGVFDRFAREIIAPQFNAIVDKFADMEESTNSWSAEEAQRVQQESARQSAEQGRVSAEGQRKTNETARLSAEENRISAENDRVTAETARVNAENGRVSAEAGRRAGEKARNVWEMYSASKAYVPGNKVSFGGSSYVCTVATVGHEPTDTAYWLLIAQKGMDGAGADDLRQINNALDAIDPTKITTKAAPADGDGVMIADSADGDKAKRLLWSNVKAALGKLFVPLARKINGKALSADVTLTGDDIAMGADDAESLRAAMAKRAVGTGVLGDEIDLNDIDTSGMYRVQKPKNGPYDYGQLLVIHGYGDTIAQVCFDYAANRCAVRCARGLYGASPKWEDWTAIALCAAPEVHELPLVDNITSNNIVYYKSQEGIVTIVGSVAGDFPASQSTLIGNVPEGFRPAYMIEVPAAFTMGATGNASVDASGHVSVAPYLGGLRYAYVAFSYPTG